MHQHFALRRRIHMVDQKDGRSHNQPPSHDEAVKGGQHSQGGKADKSQQPDQKQGSQGQPTQGESTKGGQHSHSGSKS
jgi:hypothetical protein